MSTTPGFRLSKWYMDCCTKEGDACICYAAELSLKGVKLGYSSWLHCSPAGSLDSRQTFLKGTLPEKQGETITWSCPGLQVEGKWEGMVPSAKSCLQFVDKARSCRWTCLQPRSRVELRIGGHSYEGTGYTELLEMSIPPWQLPVSELYWGRFHGEYGTTLTWVIWKGEFPLFILLEGDKEIQAKHFNTDPEGSRLEWDVNSLEFEKTFTIRAGNIGDTVLKSLPSLIRNLLPDSILLLNENKWYGRASLDRPGGREPGVAIHEVIYFDSPTPA